MAAFPLLNFVSCALKRTKKKLTECIYFEMISECATVRNNGGNSCTSAPIIFYFKLKIQYQNFCFSIFKYKLKIENHPFFSDFRFFSFLFVTVNVILKINFFQKISNFNFPFFISLVPTESRKMKMFELSILSLKVKFHTNSIFISKH